MAANQIASGLYRGLSPNLWCPRSANCVNYTEQCVICTEKHTSEKKEKFTNGLKMALPQ